VGTQLPEGLAVVADGSDVGGLMEATHHTIYPTEPMSPEAFADQFLGLPWEYRGKK